MNRINLFRLPQLCFHHKRKRDIKWVHKNYGANIFEAMLMSLIICKICLFKVSVFMIP